VNAPVWDEGSERAVLGEIAVDWKGLCGVTLLEAGVERRADGVVRVPYRDATRAEHNAKLFTPDGRSWWEQRGLPMIPFGVEQIAPPGQRDRRQVWIAEGESDALCLREHYAEWRGLSVDVIGLPGAGTWRADWAQHLDGYAAAYCFPDGDPAGERMADTVTSAVRWAIRVRLPADRDVRDLLQVDGPTALDESIMAGEAAAVLMAGMRLNRTLPELERWLAEAKW
jgi:hypothetical protein